jgi:hypothetical protein
MESVPKERWASPDAPIGEEEPFTEFGLAIDKERINTGLGQ